MVPKAPKADTAGMLTVVLLVWLLGSLPFALLVGALLRAGGQMEPAVVVVRSRPSMERRRPT
jgi:hypothetical protein